MPFNYYATRWWINKIYDLPFHADWIPQDIPTLIINGTHDFIVPYMLFEDNLRFQRNNITIKKITNAGHCPWLEEMPLITAAFQLLFEKVSLTNA
ncbi:MAG: hypothetical protein A3H43_00985 [Gammaproteobacteria bacterium RIFCSPLOWO2_02_FULL_42_9]|nr:MAG: hypothetical protein A3H43_00985 [Gammaproteobacteria bacterium RIFCSPLOWO2_02_FULL_42_9]